MGERVCEPLVNAAAGSPFDLSDDAAYGRWRAWKLAHRCESSDDLAVPIADPRALTSVERDTLLQRIARCNIALYRSPITDEDPELPRALGAQLGLHQLDANWLAGEDGISRVEVAAGAASSPGDRAGFIPYTDRAIRWHTDGYYHPEQRRIQAMILHCVRPAQSGGVNGVLDHELAYIALRDASIDHVRALMREDALTIPARLGDDGEDARPAQSGPVFSVNANDGSLHMRYTARTRSIAWRADAATSAAVLALESLLASPTPGLIHLRLDAGCGLVGHNLLHERSAFEDDATQPRLLYRARFLDRVRSNQESAWRNG